MRKILAAILTILLPLWIPTMVSAGDLPAAGPLATAAQLRNLHANSSTAGYRIVYETAIDGQKAAPSEILLAADYVEIESEGRHAIVDFKLQRLILLRSAERSFNNLSLYGDVAFRMAEAINRQHLRQFLQGMDVDASADAVDALDPFWVGAELGLADPVEPHPEIDRRTDTDGTTRFSYRGKKLPLQYHRTGACPRRCRSARCRHFDRSCRFIPTSSMRSPPTDGSRRTSPIFAGHRTARNSG